MTESWANGRSTPGSQRARPASFFSIARGETPAASSSRQPLGSGHFLKIEVRQSPHLADRHNQPAAMPAANHGHRNVQQLGQHGRRVEPMNVGLAVDQPQPLPKLRFRDDFDRAGLDGLANRLVRPGVELVALGKGQPRLAEHERLTEGSACSRTTAPWAATNWAASRRGMPARRPTKAMRFPRRSSEGVSEEGLSASDISGSARSGRLVCAVRLRTVVVRRQRRRPVGAGGLLRRGRHRRRGRRRPTPEP